MRIMSEQEIPLSIDRPILIDACIQ
jgi:hypothetical protein